MYGRERDSVSGAHFARVCCVCSHVAQECYCGEPNCVGYIGGKTQTDLGGMDDLYIDGAPCSPLRAELSPPKHALTHSRVFGLALALGIAEEVEALGLKGSKKKKGRKLDEDFTVSRPPPLILLFCARTD